MPSVPQMIRSVTRQKHIQQYIIEKDYALSYLLAAIDQTDGLAENLVLKGGTALKKLYFAEYRFSEDLDYSTRVIGPIKQIDTAMETVVHRMSEMLNERGPFQVELEPLMLKQPHPGDQKAYYIRVQFPEQRQALCRLKVEVTVDEPILTPVDIRPCCMGLPKKWTCTSRCIHWQKSPRRNCAPCCRARRGCMNAVGAPAGSVEIIMICGIYCKFPA